MTHCNAIMPNPNLKERRKKMNGTLYLPIFSKSSLILKNEHMLENMFK